ncbi:flavin-containing monooxygenase [Noviherbaspirillum sedimenti]|uniref:NAD(P)/FAD-dependent oxidoreductase n=1 Tax=Noviherbaspirillum sedimenti TaxID=2320865 RepID=A0A3A3FZ70_9BURK|nr:NAD(P)/FAD-dependent oxidoreductase [Noviherbaspirillum sedimenti]RJG00655.1 NAD(P)/FAD-dependent oxidoreductase [Noviherbaspirillum sedimenti]
MQLCEADYRKDNESQACEFDAIVVGAGFGGMYALHKLRGLGMRVRVLEAAPDVGGTWYWNRYPGLRCDAESVEYSYSFDDGLQQDWEWTEKFATQPEILRYAKHVADRFDFRRDINFETRVKSATYDEATKRWCIVTDRDEELTARFFIMATGCLSVASVPKMKGLDSFKGRWYHSSNWPEGGVNFKGLRVGVIGTGSTGIQLIPEVAKDAAHLYVFQRTPNFTVPAQNGPLSPDFKKYVKENYADIRARARQQGLGLHTHGDQSAFGVSAEERQRRFEAAWQQGGPQFMFVFNDQLKNPEANKAAVDFVHGKIRSIVKDPATADTLCPKDYPIGAKRICVDTNYYATFNRENVTLVDLRKSPIEELTEAGLKTSNGDYELDAIVFATGFDAMTGALLKVNIIGRNGLKLADKWSAGPQNLLGITVSGFPNFFMITGPGSPSVFSNVVMSIEQHVDWMVDCLKYMREQGFAAIEASAEAESSWVQHVNDVANNTLLPQANSWYVGANIPGKPRVFMPYVGGVGQFRKKCDEVAENDYSGFALERG